MNFLDTEIDEGVNTASVALGPLRIEKLQFFKNGRQQNHLADGMKGHVKVIEKSEARELIGEGPSNPMAVFHGEQPAVKYFKLGKGAEQHNKYSIGAYVAGNKDLVEGTGVKPSIINGPVLEPMQEGAEPNKSYDLLNAQIKEPQPRDHIGVHNARALSVNDSIQGSLVNIESK